MSVSINKNMTVGEFLKLAEEMKSLKLPADDGIISIQMDEGGPSSEEEADSVPEKKEEPVPVPKKKATAKKEPKYNLQQWVALYDGLKVKQSSKTGDDLRADLLRSVVSGKAVYAALSKMAAELKPKHPVSIPAVVNNAKLTVSEKATIVDLIVKCWTDVYSKQ